MHGETVKFVSSMFTLQYHTWYCCMFRSATDHHQGIKQSNTTQNQISQI